MSSALVSCHVERPLDVEVWRLFSRLQERRPGGFRIAALMRPPHEGEDRDLWLGRAREAAARGAFGHHTHWTSPTHARPTWGDPARRVREEGVWLRESGLAPTLFCGGGWYMDEAVAETVASLGYTDCTSSRGGPCLVRLRNGALLGELPTTHSIGALARNAPRRHPPFLHAYFHDYDLLDRKRRYALLVSLSLLGMHASLASFEPQAGAPEVSYDEAFAS